MSLVALWTAEIDGAMSRLRRELDFHFWCPTDHLRALHHIRSAVGLTYEQRSRVNGRVSYWERRKRAGLVAEAFDIEAQILTELKAFQ